MINKLKLFADYHCNLACSHCVQNVDKARTKLSLPILGQNEPRNGLVFLEDLKAFLTDLARAKPDMSIYLSGGEPFGSRRWFEVAHILHDLGLRYKTISNGTLLDRKIDEVLAVRPAWISFTFNGVGERHDQVVAVPGAFAAMTRGLRRHVQTLLDHGIWVEATYVITTHSHRTIVEDIRSLADIPFRKFVLQHLSFLEPEICDEHREVYHKLFQDPSEFIFGEESPVPEIDVPLLHEQIRRFREERWPFAIDVYPPLVERDELEDYYSPDPQFYRLRKCERFHEEIWILPEGRITSCFNHTFGHVATHRLSDILQSERREQWVETLLGESEPLPGCRRCHRIHTFPRQVAVVTQA